MSDAPLSSEDQVTYFACGPSNSKCKCTCGVEGIPHVCEHQWDGEGQEFDGGCGWTATCSRCGMTALSHSMWVGP